MAAFGHMQGARLEFVVRPLKGKRQAPQHVVKDKKILTEMKSVDAGFIVYTPQGLSYRLSKQELTKRGYDRQPEIMNLDQVKDTKSPAGRFKHAMTDQQRQAAWKDMEKQIIRACERRHGPVVNNEKEVENVGQSA